MSDFFRRIFSFLAEGFLKPLIPEQRADLDLEWECGCETRVCFPHHLFAGIINESFHTGLRFQAWLLRPSVNGVLTGR